MQQIRRRQVFYLAGLDPRGVKFYRRLYARQAALQQSVNGCEYKVTALNQSDPLAPFWDVETLKSDTAKVETRYHYLRWDDLLQAHWPQSDLRAILGCLVFLTHFFFSGALIRLWRYAKQYAIVVYTPLIWIVMTLLLSSGLAWVAWKIGLNLFGISSASSASSPYSLRISWLVAMAAMTVMVAVIYVAVIYVAVRYARHLQIFWLARASIFVHQLGMGRDPLLDPRWAVLANKIKQIIQDNDADEYVIVGHCAGSIVAVSVIAYLLDQQLREDDEMVLASRMRRVQLLTLGQIVPTLTLYKGAYFFREQLKTVASSSISWFDLNSPHDALSCGLAGPLAASNLSQSLEKLPMTRSARFDQMMSEADYRVLKKDVLQVHFQYLMATKVAVFNDYFSLTAGSKSMAECCARQS